MKLIVSGLLPFDYLEKSYDLYRKNGVVVGGQRISSIEEHPDGGRQYHYIRDDEGDEVIEGVLLLYPDGKVLGVTTNVAAHKAVVKKVTASK